MTTFDAATEARIQELLDDWPPLSDEQVDLIVRTFARASTRNGRPAPPNDPDPSAS